MLLYLLVDLHATVVLPSPPNTLSGHIRKTLSWMGKGTERKSGISSFHTPRVIQRPWRRSRSQARLRRQDRPSCPSFPLASSLLGLLGCSRASLAASTRTTRSMWSLRRSGKSSRALAYMACSLMERSALPKARSAWAATSSLRSTRRPAFLPSMSPRVHETSGSTPSRGLGLLGFSLRLAGGGLVMPPRPRRVITIRCHQ
mmetsp:Transcript_43383/g.102454  ORF Transcript_43383/g.102454 Transcript_43383/m.102454 type:complete len:201 (-) Transcript_43383:29-631(-)